MRRAGAEDRRQREVGRPAPLPAPDFYAARAGGLPRGGARRWKREQGNVMGGGRPDNRPRTPDALPMHHAASAIHSPAAIASSDFRLTGPACWLIRYIVMVAHAEPVEVWGLEPCGSFGLSSQSRVWLGTVAARRTRRAPGAAYSGSNVADQHPRLYGRPTILWAEARKLLHEQERSSPAAAPSVQPRLAF